MLFTGVAGVSGGHITEDDAQGGSDVKVFASVALLVEAINEDDAESFNPPAKLLTYLADVMGAVDGESLIGLDGSWEVVDVEESEDMSQCVERMS